MGKENTTQKKQSPQRSHFLLNLSLSNKVHFVNKKQIRKHNPQRPEGRQLLTPHSVLAGITPTSSRGPSNTTEQLRSIGVHMA